MTDIAERVAAIEARGEDVLRRIGGLETGQQAQTVLLQEIRAQLVAQATARGIAGWFAEGARTLFVAIAAGFAATHWFTR